MKSIVLLLGALAFSSSAFANLSVVCTAKGMKTSQAGAGMLKTNARIEFDVEDYDADSDEVMTIGMVTGTIQVGLVDETGELTRENSYIGHFDIGSMQSNPKYRPRRYTNMVQFKDFDAKTTTGVERGMWGYFLVEKTLGERFDAKYIFQAGDHMGGTVHFSCRSSD